MTPYSDHLVHRLQKLSIPSPSYPSISLHPSSPSICTSNNTLDTYSWPEYPKESQDGLIDSFALRCPSFDLSPTSSTSSDLDLSLSCFDTFVATQSRVVRVSAHPPFRFFSFLTPPPYSYPIYPLPPHLFCLRFSFKMLVPNSSKDHT